MKTRESFRKLLRAEAIIVPRTTLQRHKTLRDAELRKTCGIITTLSKTADYKLKSAKKPVIAVIDKSCQSTDLETLLV